MAVLFSIPFLWIHRKALSLEQKALFSFSSKQKKDSCSNWFTTKGKEKELREGRALQTLREWKQLIEVERRKRALYRFRRPAQWGLALGWDQMFSTCKIGSWWETEHLSLATTSVAGKFHFFQHLNSSIILLITTYNLQVPELEAFCKVSSSSSQFLME